ncbi:MAG: UDP-N-acetylmuramoyl-L-alanyl-D-glutamate--2,6-diaminopimelate ligase [Myxococcota bacterium]
MRLEDLIRGMAIVDRRGHFDAEVRTITADSRKVGDGDVFVAIRGGQADGHGFIEPAVRQGAKAVIAEEWPEGMDESLGKKPNVVLVEDARRALALTAANLFGEPSRDMVLGGVTGTNGKTTVTHVLDAVLSHAGKKTGVLGTVGARYPGKSLPLQHTTPDPLILQGILAKMLNEEVSHVVMEVSSHALDQQRVGGVHFKVVGFTNLTQDHLDYHKNIDTYAAAKRRLFSEVLPASEVQGRMAVVNLDDPRGEEMAEAWGGKTLTVSLERGDADLFVSEVEYGLGGTRAVVENAKGSWDLTVPLIGAHNLSNVMVAVGMAEAMGLSPSRIAEGLKRVAPVPGRLEPIENEDDKRVFVDYAHTPDALDKVLACLAPLTSERLIVVFGCGGDRDVEKRPLMAAAVARHAHVAVVTSDNPRSEDPAEIASAVELGLKEAGWSRFGTVVAPRTFATELDRRKAIELAVSWMEPGDVLVVAGKGHERTQIIKDAERPFDDREETRRVLAGLPPAPPPPPIPPSDVETAQVVDSVDIDPDIVDEESEKPPERDS